MISSFWLRASLMRKRCGWGGEAVAARAGATESETVSRPNRRMERTMRGSRPLFGATFKGKRDPEAG
jgi:hypothetical protein